MSAFDMALLDWIFFVILLASLIVGAWRGLVFEVLSALNWLSAFVLAQWLGPDLAQKLPMSDSNDAVRMAAGFVGVFIVAVFVGGLVAHLLKKLVESVGLRCGQGVGCDVWCCAWRGRDSCGCLAGTDDGLQDERVVGRVGGCECCHGGAQRAQARHA